MTLTLDETTDKLAVVETLYHFAAGIDLRDRDLLASVFAEDAISDFRPAAAKAGFEYPVLEGRETIVEALSTSLRSLARPILSAILACAWTVTWLIWKPW